MVKAKFSSPELDKLAAEAAAELSTKKKVNNKTHKEAEKDKENVVPDAGGEAAAAAAAPSEQSSRVFVSSLPHDVKADELEEIFSECGPLKDTKLNKDGSAVLNFALVADATRCVEEMNGVKVKGKAVIVSRHAKGEGAAGDGTEHGDMKHGKANPRLFRLVIRNLPFGIKEAAVRAAFERFGRLLEVHLPMKLDEARKPVSRGFGFLQFSSRKEAKAAVEEGNGLDLLGRPVAVDWALAKEVYQEVMGAPKKSSSAEASKPEEEGKKDTKRKREEAEEANKGKDKKTKTGQEAEGSKQQELKRTVFVRNIPLEASDQEVKETFRRFGKIKLCKLVLDKATGKHKGTAFIQYAEEEAAAKAVEAGGAFTGSEEWEKVQKKKDKLQSVSFIKSTLEREFQETLSLHGRHLFVAFAVDRNDVEKVSSNKEKIDKRNLYLAKEGLILADMKEAKNCPPQDLAKRLRDWQEKKQKLANTNFFINRTRLSVRNLSKDMTEPQLKALFKTAVENASGKDDTSKVQVLSAKLVRNKEKVDPVTNKFQSKGYGFVEFSEHEHALLALRKLNNCPITAKKHNQGKRLMIDFAIDDARILRQRRIKEERTQRAKLRRQANEEVEESEEKKAGRGARQRMKKKEKRAASASAKGDEKEGRGKASPAAAQQKKQEKPKKQQTAGEGRGTKTETRKRKLDVKDGGIDKEIHNIIKHEPTGSVKRSKKTRKDVVDDFDKLVQKYNKTLFKADDARWFD